MDLDVTKSKFFQFNFTLEGIDYRSLSGKLEFIYENVIYAFPTKIKKDRVEVEIPPLQSVIKKHILESDDLTANLEIIGETFHLPAWKSELSIKRSLFIESEEPNFEDVKNITEDKNSNIRDISNNSNILKEDVDFLRKLKKDMSSDEFYFDDKNIQENTNPVKSINKSKITHKPKSIKSKIKKPSFNKRAFLKEASEQEQYAVENGIPLSETSKNDTLEEKDFRIKIRDIIQEEYIKKIKSVKTKIPETLVEHSKIVKESNVFDPDSINETNVDKQAIRMMMESVGMTTEKTQNRMIENAKDKGAKTDIQIYDDIKGLLFPANNQNNNQLQESYQKAYEVFQKQN